jgi:hypothetical protein
VAFSKNSRSPTWKRICPGKYKHVSLVRYSAKADSWVLIDLNFSGVDVLLGPGDTEVIEAINNAVGEADILLFKVKERPPITIRLLFTCVQFIKHALGVRAPFVLFPDQLFKKLKDEGAELMIAPPSVRRTA